MRIERLWPPTEAPGFVWAHWVVIAERLGVEFPLHRGVLLCLRGARLRAAESHPMRSVAEYDDTGVLMTNAEIEVFPMSSHAYQVNSRLSPDVDGDGRGDVGTIVPGRYLLRDLRAGKYPIFHLTTTGGYGAIPCYRDTNHDGVIEHGELTKQYTATSILVHGGLDDPPDSPHHYSIGCQCVPLAARQLMVGAARDDLLDYVLVKAEDAVALAPDYEPPDMA